MPLRPDNEPRGASTQDEAVAVVREAFAARRAVYPVGGGGGLDFGLPAARPGIELSLAELNRVVDYPHRDLTVTIEAGLRLADLAARLAEQGQWLPIDAPRPAEATVGGALATGAGGSRRFGHGTLRDYLIGVTAIDGRGTRFHSGGRVVKNVAGYDLGKLLIGSLGTLAVITQATFKVKPRPAACAFLACAPRGAAEAESLLAALGRSLTTPVSVDWLLGPAWAEPMAELGLPEAPHGVLLVGLEGTADEVVFMQRELAAEWQAQGTPLPALVEEPEAVDAWWERLRDFPARRGAALSLRIAATPSACVALVGELTAFAPTVDVLAHAGNGVVVAHLAEFPPEQLSRWLIARLQQRVRAARGHVVVLRAPGLKELTRQAVWGPAGDDRRLMQAVKRQFDPADILNPGRFVFEAL